MKSQKLTSQFIADLVARHSEEFVGESLKYVGGVLEAQSVLKLRGHVMIDSKSRFVLLVSAPSNLSTDTIYTWLAARDRVMQAKVAGSVRIVVVSTKAFPNLTRLFKIYGIEFWFISQEDLVYRAQQVQPDLIIDFNRDDEFDKSIQAPVLTARTVLQTLSEDGKGPHIEGAFVFWIRGSRRATQVEQRQGEILDNVNLEEVAPEGIDGRRTNSILSGISDDTEVAFDRDLMPEQVILDWRSLDGMENERLKLLSNWIELMERENQIVLGVGHSNGPYHYHKSGRVKKFEPLLESYCHYDKPINVDQIGRDLAALKDFAVYVGGYPHIEKVHLFDEFSIQSGPGPLREDFKNYYHHYPDRLAEVDQHFVTITVVGLKENYLDLFKDVIDHLLSHATKRTGTLGGSSYWERVRRDPAKLTLTSLSEPCARCYQQGRPISQVSDKALKLAAQHFKWPKVREL